MDVFSCFTPFDTLNLRIRLPHNLSILLGFNNWYLFNFLVVDEFLECVDVLGLGGRHHPLSFEIKLLVYPGQDVIRESI